MSKLLSRRNFCIGTAALGTSLLFAGCSSAPEESKTDEVTDDVKKAEEIVTDVVVIGSGLGGSACARSAAENGAKVVLVEKAGIVGPTFMTSMGNVSICQIPENKDFWHFTTGEEDSLDAAVVRYAKATEIGKIDTPYPDYERVQLIMEESCETISWAEGIGVDFQESFGKDQVGTDTVKPDVSAADGKVGGNLYMHQMASMLEELGVDIKLSTEATELILEDGAVVGVRVNDGKTTDSIKAKAVVLATGGFGGSEAYCKKLVPAIEEIGFQYQGNQLNTGDGMALAEAAGAAMYEDPWVIPNVIIPSRALTTIDTDFSLLCDPSVWGQAFEGGHTSKKMLVDTTGQRFINEASPAIALASMMTDRNAAPYYVLFDSSDDQVTSLLEKGLDTGDIFKAETIAELAQSAGMDSLEASFEAYQSAASQGVDEAFSKATESLITYQDGPFYLVKYVPSFVATMGGVKTSIDCQVVDETGSAIEGLYAVGEATHRFMYNRSFVRHYSNQSAMTMGRLTGKAVSELS